MFLEPSWPEDLAHMKPAREHTTDADEGLALLIQNWNSSCQSLGSAGGFGAYLRGSFSKLGEHLGPVVRDDAQRVVQ